MALSIFVFTWITAELELNLFSLNDYSLFGRENGFFSNLAYVKDHTAIKKILNEFQMVNLMKADLYQNL